MAITAADIARATAPNSSFSKQLPGLQLAVDSTSLGEFKKCPRSYFYSIVMGYQPRQQSVHLTFGLLVHGAREAYEGCKANGEDHEDALRGAVAYAMCATWDPDLGRGWVSDHKLKNRLTLIRTIVWYLDEFGRDDALETVQLASGRPAIELSFRFDSGYASPATDEPWTLCGHLDRIATLNDEPYVVDIKTTGSSISQSFFNEFSPGNQFSMYSLAGRVAFGMPVRGVVVDGIQVATGFSRMLRGLVQRTPASLDEWLAEVGYWLVEMSDCAEAGVWPQNDRSCHHYGGCQFRGVCARSPGARQLVLDSDFTQRVWDPLVHRGDV
jgi:hypothetical protein